MTTASEAGAPGTLSDEEAGNTANTAPPLSDGEAPPLPNEEAPTLPSEEAPPLPNESVPTLPNETAPPLPNEAPPGTQPSVPQQPEDDGWAPIWDDTHQAYYFYNRFTNVMQWENPRVPTEHAPGTAPPASTTVGAPGTNSDDMHHAVAGGYNPAIHGSYDPNAPYAQVYAPSSSPPPGLNGHLPGAAPGTEDYAATGQFNRFTGRFQAAEINPDNHNDEAKSKRQMAAFFDVDRAANSHDGRSLKAERSGKKLSKKELKEFQAKRREKKEEKRRAWLRD